MNNLKLASVVALGSLAMVGCAGNEVTQEDLLAQDWELHIAGVEDETIEMDTIIFDASFGETEANVAISDVFVEALVEETIRAEEENLGEPMDQQSEQFLRQMMHSFTSFLDFTMEYSVADSQLNFEVPEEFTGEGQTVDPIPMVWDGDNIILDIDTESIQDESTSEETTGLENATFTLIPASTN